MIAYYEKEKKNPLTFAFYLKLENTWLMLGQNSILDFLKSIFSAVGLKQGQDAYSLPAAFSIAMV